MAAELPTPTLAMVCATSVAAMAAIVAFPSCALPVSSAAMLLAAVDSFRSR
eukprot:CAMPEP_0179227654 /NCGR_PEP_ID=MMETSP0797-20121207/9426_1 /TAXON_ID=47934 /ORGANISM="Dinophysis acuminata, Strain DAEP01" /LENGTH=50 /DNA_ID=CAMNT_0020934691 /DNA_START=80 /DNA_END=232 /DNA_ORIENTATION=+